MGEGGMTLCIGGVKNRSIVAVEMMRETCWTSGKVEQRNEAEGGTSC